MLTVNFFLCFHFISLQSVNMHKHAYICAHIYYSNDFDLHKIQVMQDLQEWNDCVIWGASVLENESRSNLQNIIYV
jgi:hypothetical protein